MKRFIKKAVFSFNLGIEESYDNIICAKDSKYYLYLPNYNDEGRINTITYSIGYNLSILIIKVITTFKNNIMTATE